MCSTFIQLAFQFPEIYDITGIKGFSGKIFSVFLDRLRCSPSKNTGADAFSRLFWLFCVRGALV
jgi:hypothetical protein